MLVVCRAQCSPRLRRNWEVILFLTAGAGFVSLLTAEECSYSGPGALWAFLAPHCLLSRLTLVLCPKAKGGDYFLPPAAAGHDTCQQQNHPRPRLFLNCSNLHFLAQAPNCMWGHLQSPSSQAVSLHPLSIALFEFSCWWVQLGSYRAELLLTAIICGFLMSFYSWKGSPHSYRELGLLCFCAQHGFLWSTGFSSRSKCLSRAVFVFP